MARSDIADRRRTFRRLHESGCFVIPNPWDVGSARMLQGLGFKALATTSSGYAWSQAPKSRTVRLITNVEVFAAKDGNARMVRSNFLISEFRVDGTRYLSGWCGHRFVEHGGRWLIAVRQVNLIDCDQCIRNPSIVI